MSLLHRLERLAEFAQERWNNRTPALHRLDMICVLVGWHRNPWGREIERRLWVDLERDYPELRGRL